jgi:hypothetical protein
MAYATHYKVTDKNGKVVENYSPEEGSAVCFSDYVRLGNRRSTVSKLNGGKIEIYILKDYSKARVNHIYVTNHAFSENDIFDYSKALNFSGFLHSIEDSGEYHTIKLDEDDYINSVHVRIFFDFIRALWEKGPDNAAINFLKIPKKVRLKIDPFQLIQVCGCYTGHGQGHPLPNVQYVPRPGCVISRSEMENRLKMHLDGSTFYLWNEISWGKAIRFSKIDFKKLGEIQIKSVKDFDDALEIINGEAASK